MLLNDKSITKLCDFGLGKIKTMRTVSSAAVGINGTPFYMAPEVILNGKSSSASYIYMVFRVHNFRFNFWCRSLVFSGRWR